MHKHNSVVIYLISAGHLLHLLQLFDYNLAIFLAVSEFRKFRTDCRRCWIQDESRLWNNLHDFMTLIASLLPALLDTATIVYRKGPHRRCRVVKDSSKSWRRSDKEPSRRIFQCKERYHPCRVRRSMPKHSRGVVAQVGNVSIAQNTQA